MASAKVEFEIWTTTVTLVVTDSGALSVAESLLREELAAIEAAASRFQPDSEINRIGRHPGVEVEVSPVLNELMAGALRMAAATGYLVDPTVGAAVIALGYDRDIDSVQRAGESERAGQSQGAGQSERLGQSERAGDSQGAGESERAGQSQGAGESQCARDSQGAGESERAGQSQGAGESQRARDSQGAGDLQGIQRPLPVQWIAGGVGGPAPGAWRIQHDPATRKLLIPGGIAVDLGATAKAIAADRAALMIATRLGCGVLVSLGGDLAVSGPAPDQGWQVAIGHDHRTAGLHPQDQVSIESGGIATSSTAVRRWTMAGRERHHIVDPRTGGNPNSPWQTVSAAAASCLEANAATTAAIVLGEGAPVWLAAQGIPARLVDTGGRVALAGGWPVERGRAA